MFLLEKNRHRTINFLERDIYPQKIIKEKEKIDKEILKKAGYNGREPGSGRMVMSELWNNSLKSRIRKIYEKTRKVEINAWNINYLDEKAVRAKEKKNDDKLMKEQVKAARDLLVSSNDRSNAIISNHILQNYQPRSLSYSLQIPSSTSPIHRRHLDVSPFSYRVAQASRANIQIGSPSKTSPTRRVLLPGFQVLRTRGLPSKLSTLIKSCTSLMPLSKHQKKQVKEAAPAPAIKSTDKLYLTLKNRLNNLRKREDEGILF